VATGPRRSNECRLKNSSTTKRGKAKFHNLTLGNGRHAVRAWRNGFQKKKKKKKDKKPDLGIRRAATYEWKGKREGPGQTDTDELKGERGRTVVKSLRQTAA